jgi:CBS domain containing-hemolysin-like protein
MTTVLLLAGLLLAIGLSAFASGFETGVYCLDRLRLRVACEQRDPAALRLEPLMRHPEDLVISALVGTNVADYLATACMTALLLHLAITGGLAELYATAIVTPLLLVFGGIIPKDWFRRESNRLMARLSGPLWVWLRLVRTTGLVRALRALPRAVLRRLDPAQAESEAELLPRARTLHLLREGAARGGLTHFQRDVIERVLNLSGVRVSQVMIPRNRAAMIPQDIARQDFLRLARMAHFSRLPVYRGDMRHVVGVINVYEVLTDRDGQPIAEHTRPPLTLADYVSVSAALLKLQRARQTMAIVEDRAGHCVGVLTLKDLVEEIVGDLEVW